MTDALVQSITDIALKVCFVAFFLAAMLAVVQVSMSVRLGVGLARPIVSMVVSLFGAAFCLSAPLFMPGVTAWLAKHLPEHASAAQSTDGGSAAVIFLMFIPVIVMLSMDQERR